MKALKKKMQTKPDSSKAAIKKILAQIKAKKDEPKFKDFFLIDLGNIKFKVANSNLGKVLSATKGKLIPILPRKDKDEVISTQEVADLLNVSRPFVTKLIDSGKLAGFMVGNQRRVKKEDAIKFKVAMRKTQDKALSEMTSEAEGLGLDF